jgi:uncharacterized protein
LSRGFYVACEDLKPDRKFVIYGGQDTFSLREDVLAISLYTFMKYVGEK